MNAVAASRLVGRAHPTSSHAASPLKAAVGHMASTSRRRDTLDHKQPAAKVGGAVRSPGRSVREILTLPAAWRISASQCLHRFDLWATPERQGRYRPTRSGRHRTCWIAVFTDLAAHSVRCVIDRTETPVRSNWADSSQIVVVMRPPPTSGPGLVIDSQANSRLTQKIGERCDEDALKSSASFVRNFHRGPALFPGMHGVELLCRGFRAPTPRRASARSRTMLCKTTTCKSP